MKRSLLPLLLLLPLLVFLLARISSRSGDPGADHQTVRQPVRETVGVPARQPQFRSVSAAEAAALIRTREGLRVIDVRTPQERRQFRIADTALVPVGDVIRGVFKVEPDRPVMLICAVGGRSYVAGKALAARGYLEVYNLDGGIESWRRAGLPLETGPEGRP